MWWVFGWALVIVLGAVGTVASLNGLRFEHRVAAEARALASASAPQPASIRPVPLSTLPPPVQRYLLKTIGERSQPIRSVRLRHNGVFRPSLTGSWLPIRGEQYFTADPPAFVWWGRVRMAPGLWIDARDRSAAGAGNMFVTLESTITIANSSGPELDQGALARLLGEMTWFPTAFRAERYVRWTAIDDRHASATLEVGGRRISGAFAFGADDLPVEFSAERYRDVGGGRSVLTPFLGRFADFRPVNGVLVPYRVVAAWIVDGAAIEYARFDVKQVDFDWTAPW